MKASIEIKHLQKTYPGFQLQDINLTVPSGCIMGLVGENGAGKTTLIKLLLNIVKKDSGTVRLLNGNHDMMEKELKEEIGVVLDNSFFSEMLNPIDIDKIMKQVYRSWDSPLFFQYLKTFALPPKKKIRDYSKGMQMKLQIATAFSHHPKLLILDEPTSGLDPVVRNEILDLFQEFIQDEEHTILFSTHITSDLEHIADYITFIHEGKLVLSKTSDDLKEKYGILHCDDQLFARLDPKNIIKYRQNRYDIEVLVEDPKQIKKEYRDVHIDTPTIEEILVLLTKGASK